MGCENLSPLNLLIATYLPNATPGVRSGTLVLIVGVLDRARQWNASSIIECSILARSPLSSHSLLFSGSVVI